MNPAEIVLQNGDIFIDEYNICLSNLYQLKIASDKSYWECFNSMASQFIDENAKLITQNLFLGHVYLLLDL